MALTHSDTEVYQAHALELTRYANVLVGPDDACDVVNEAVFSAFRSPSWPHVQNRRAYLYRAVLNTATSWRLSNERRKHREHVVALRSDTVRFDRDSSTDAHAALATVSPQQRAVVFLTYWEDKTPADIANILDISEGTVKKQLARAREQLRKVMNHG
jgi:RNA polymerase sigma factor (sigma-70 family)